MDDLLIDQYLPTYTYRSYHRVAVKATCPEAFWAAQHLDMNKSRLCRVLLQLRRLPTQDLTFGGFSRNMGFIYLDERPYHEFVMGFYMNSGMKTASRREVFLAEGHHTKVAFNFLFQALPDGQTQVSTETRIWCLSLRSKILFSVYWFLIKPFSGLIRIEWLRMIKQAAEVQPRKTDLSYPG